MNAGLIGIHLKCLAYADYNKFLCFIYAINLICRGIDNKKRESYQNFLFFIYYLSSAYGLSDLRTVMRIGTPPKLKVSRKLFVK